MKFSLALPLALLVAGATTAAAHPTAEPATEVNLGEYQVRCLGA